VAASALGVGSGRTQDAQQKPPEPEQQPTPVFRAKVDLVRVDVSVTDADGTAITGLESNDFTIREDGLPQIVQTVQFVRLDGQAVPDSNESLEIRGPSHAAMEAAKDDVRLFALMLDDYHIDRKPHITLPLRKALEAFVDQLGPRDLVVVMDPLTPLSHLRFTRSRYELLNIVRSFEGRRGELYPVRSLLEEGQLTQPNVWELRSGVTLSALTALVTHLGGLREGRKSVIFVSQGPPIGRPNDPNYVRMEEAIQAANTGNVTINVLDPRPLGTTGVGGPEVLRRLSADTGGRAIVNTNDLEHGLTQTIVDASAYYLVGYTPSRDLADGKFHRIEVDVKRRGARVLARRGYWAPRLEEMTPGPVAAPEEPALVGALADLSEPMDGRLLDVWVGTSRPGADEGASLAVTWEPVASRSGTKPPARLSVEPVSPGGGEPLAPPQIIASATTGGRETAMASFDLSDGSLVLRFVALDARGEIVDRWTQPVTIQSRDDEDIDLITPRVLRARSQFEFRALEANPDPVPVASRRFRSTDRVFVEIESNTAGVTLAAELINRTGRRMRDLTVPLPSGARRRITVPLSGLAPGVYAVRVRASRGDQEKRQLVPFQIVP
jgi:VWFA-related protein